MSGLLRGFKVGHFTDEAAGSGCTVVLPPAGNVSSCDVRGSSPSSRELELLHPDRRLEEVHAILLTGGSAFGLAAADGVVAWLAEQKRGYLTTAGVVPIVPAAVIFDLRLEGSSPPDASAGRRACEQAGEDGVATGLVGAGRGATVGKWAGREHAVAGGFGLGHADSDGMRVGAVAVVNPVGDVVSLQGEVLAGTRVPRPRFTGPGPPEEQVPTNTVLALLAVEATLDKRAVRWLAGRGSDGVTLSVRPAHTRYDGDVTFACAAPSEGPPADLDVLGRLATEAVAAAVRSAVS
jgi:L-aminopeptidase/D-esterase-like protein